MGDFLNDWGLSIPTFLPISGAAVMLLISKDREQLHKLIALATTVAVAVFGVLLLIQFIDNDDYGSLNFVVDKGWIDVIDSRYIMGVDGISLPLILLTMLIVPLCVIYSWNHFPEPRNPKAFLMLLLILETGMIGTFAAQDLILFFVFFEVVLLPMYFMIGVWGGENRRYAAIKFFLFTLFGSALMLVSFLALYFLADPVMVGGEEVQGEEADQPQRRAEQGEQEELGGDVAPVLAAPHPDPDGHGQKHDPEENEEKE